MSLRSWERQHKESEEAFQGFVIYRDMGVDRALVAVSKELKKRISLVERWSIDWSWVSRCTQWDNHVDRENQKQQIKEILEMRKRHVNIAMAMQGKVVSCIKAMQDSNLTPDQASKWMDIAVKIERLSRGEATENVKKMDVSGNGSESFNLGPLTIQDLVTLEKIAAKGRYGKNEITDGATKADPSGYVEPEGNPKAD